MVDLASTIFRDFETDGVPASGAHKPRKSKIREWGTWLEGRQIGTGMLFGFSASMADGDPGAGLFRMNNAVAASATAMFIDDTDAGGASVGAIISGWDDSTNPVRGTITFKGIDDNALTRTYNVTGTVIDGAGYRKVTIAHVGGNGEFVAGAEYVVSFARAGDADTKLFNIRNYGASPAAPAATNDAAIADALAAADAAGGGKVYVPIGTYLHNLTIPMKSNVELFGDGDGSVLKSNTLANIGIGHIHVDCTGMSHFSIHDLCLDASGVTPFTTGMRSVNCTSTTHDYAIERVLFKTPGAAVASIGSYNFRIADNWVYCISTDGISHHDGVIDQWAGAHDFDVINNKVIGGGICRYGILVTGVTGLPTTPAPCYNFRIHDNDVSDVLHFGIWVNGRSGINHDFSVCNNRVDQVSLYHGIGIADSDYGVVSGNLVKNVQYVGLFLYAEGSGGVTGCRNVTVMDNIIQDANMSGLGNFLLGAGIALSTPSTGCIIDGNIVTGTTQSYGLTIENGTGSCVIGATNVIAAGTLGTISYGTSASNVKVPASNVTNTFTAAQIISLASAGVALSLVSTDAGAALGPALDLYRNSPSPASFDQGGTIYASFNNAGGAKVAYGVIEHIQQAVTAGAENGAWDFQTRRAGALASRMVLGNGLFTSNATGGDKGLDTINAGAYYVGGVLISPPGAPVVKTADFTVAATEKWLINNKAAATCTVTLPSAATFIGREITITNRQAFTVVSASANVVPIAGGAAATAILAATAGKFATLVSDGTNWLIMASN